MFQSLVSEAFLSWDELTKHVPADKKYDLDFLLELLDWEANVDPAFKETYFRPPLPVKPLAEMTDAGYTEHWIAYGNP